MKPNRGSTAIYSMRPTKHMFCILRYPSDGDGLVSQGFQNTALLGTSSIDVEDPDDNEPGMDEIKIMEDSLKEVVPGILDARAIRMCAGVRPLYSEGKETGRDVSRGITLLDHEEMEGVQGLITITGGKYATARLMAELAVDIACEKLVGKVIPCTSHKQMIYGASSREEDVYKRQGQELVWGDVRLVFVRRESWRFCQENLERKWRIFAKTVLVRRWYKVEIRIVFRRKTDGEPRVSYCWRRSGGISSCYFRERERHTGYFDF